MIPKSNLKYIKSLLIKKIRKQEKRFVVEGAKSVAELLNSDFKTDSLFLTSEFYNCYKQNISTASEVFTCTESELSAAGSMISNNGAIAIAQMKDNIYLPPNSGTYSLLLDDIRDPGNLGTIIRIADWYGMSRLICSENTAEFYNPKVIAATMGSFTRVKVFYGNLQEYIEKANRKVYGALLEGDNLHEINFGTEGLVIIGNESNGISNNLVKYIQQSIHIPRFGNAESLNAAVATGIILDNIARSSKSDRFVHL